MSVPEAIGYAIVSFDQLDVSTVSPTERGAIVNWLVTSARIPVYAWSQDDEIFKTWRSVKGRDHHLMPVSILACTLPPACSWCGSSEPCDAAECGYQKRRTSQIPQAQVGSKP